MDLDAPWPQLAQQAFGQGNHPGLGDVVIAHPRCLHQRGHRGNVDDATTVCGQQQRQERLAALDHTHEVDADLPVPVLQRQVLEPASGGHAGIIDEDIDTLHHLLAALRQRRQLAVIAHVAATGEPAATGLLHQAQRLLQPLFLNVRQRQPGALPGIPQCQLPPQSAACPGYHYSLRFHTVSISPMPSHFLFLSQTGSLAPV